MSSKILDSNYRIIVGVDPSELSSKKYKSEIQKELNSITGLKIKPGLNLEKLRKELAEAKRLLDSIQTTSLVTIDFSEESIQNFNAFSAEIANQFTGNTQKKIEASWNRMVKGIVTQTNELKGSMDTIKQVGTDLSRTVTNLQDMFYQNKLAGQTTKLHDSVKSLVTVFGELGNASTDTSKLRANVEEFANIIAPLSEELSKNPIKYHFDLPDVQQMKKDIMMKFQNFRAQVYNDSDFIVHLKAVPTLYANSDGKSPVVGIDAEVTKTSISKSVSNAIHALNDAHAYQKLKLDIDRDYFAKQFTKTFSAKLTINNFEDVDSKIATLKTQLHELQSAAKITIDDSDLEKLANSDIKTNAILDPQALIETNKLLQEIILTLELFYDLVDDIGKINPISKVVDGDDFVKQVSLYHEAIQGLQELSAAKFKVKLSHESDISSDAYKNATKEYWVARRNINDELVRLGATKEIRDEIGKIVDTEEQSLRIAHEQSNVERKISQEKEKQREDIRKANELLKEYQTHSKKLAGLVGKESTEEYKAVEKLCNDAADAFTNFITAPTTNVGDKFDGLWDDFSKNIPGERQNIELVKTSKLYDTLKKRAKEYEIELSNLDVIERKIQGMTIFEKQINNTPGYNTYLSNLKEARKILNDIHNAEATGDYDALDGYYKTLDDLTVRINAFYKAQQNINAAVIGDNKELDKLNKLGASLSQYLDNYEKKLKKLPSLYQKFLDLQRKLNNNEISAADATRELNQIQIAARAAGVEVTTLWDRLKKSFAGNFRGQLANTGWMLMSTSIRQVYQNVVQLDTAMTELKKVTNETEDAYINFLDNAEDRAKKLGATLVDTVSATADMARLGYSMEDASNLADVALIYKNVGDGIENIDDASATIISTMQGFGIEAEKAIQIVDRFNEVANKYASSAGDIGAITKRSASAMQVAGSTLDETIALGVTANEVVQDAEQVGNGLKTLSMRLRSTKSDMEAAGEDTSGMADSVSKLRDEILAITGVDLQLDEDTYKTPYQILVEIGKVWDQLSDMERANVGEMLFGKQRANIGFAILENYERAESILKTSQESAGSAFRENEIYLESIQGRLDKLTASWQSLSNNLLDSDTVKSAVSGANAVLDIVNAIVEKLGLMPGLIAAAGTVWAQHNHVGKECALLLRAA